MNKSVENFTRTEMHMLIDECNDGEQLMFKRMYSHQNLDADIHDIINQMPVEKLDNALSQIERTVNKK